MYIYPREIPGLLNAAFSDYELSWAVNFGGKAEIIRGTNLEDLCRLDFTRVFVVHLRPIGRNGWPTDEHLLQQTFMPELVSLSLLKETTSLRPWICHFHVWSAETSSANKDLKRLYNRLRKVARQMWPATFEDGGVKEWPKSLIVSAEAQSYFVKNGFGN